jgi:putative ATP-dependent endonuclease of OLD family
MEADLVTLSNAIVAGSDTLQAVTAALTKLNQSVGSIGSPAINPLPISLEELARSLSVDLDTGSGALPIRLHGAGARSLASLQIQGVLYERLLGADGGTIKPHPVTLVEEPEAHLHPQACAEVPYLLGAMAGQVVASTHSSEIVTEVEPRSIRLIRPAAGGLTVVDLGPADSDQTALHRAFRPSQHTSEMEKLKRLVERPFGEVLFSSAIVLGDGATERAFLPPLLRHALGARAHGLCVIDPESLKSDVAKAAVKFAEFTGLPWFALADSDDPGRHDVADLVSCSGRQQIDTIIWNGKTDAAAPNGRDGATEAMVADFDSQLAKDACELVRPDLAPVSDILKSMSQFKGSIGATLAGLVIQRHPDHTQWPAPLQELVLKLSAVLP